MSGRTGSRWHWPISSGRRTAIFQMVNERQDRLEARLDEFIQETNRNFQMVNERQDRLEARLDEFIQETNRNFQMVNERQDRLEAALAEFIRETDRNFQMVNEKFQLLNERHDLQEARTARLEATVNRLIGRMDNVAGSNYELKIEKTIGSPTGEYLHIHAPRILKGAWTAAVPELIGLIHQASGSGVITLEQAKEIWDMDLIFTGRRDDTGEEAHVAAEISITIGTSDITRAIDRAAILESIISRPVIPAVIGAHIDEARTALAETRGVTVMLRPE